MVNYIIYGGKMKFKSVLIKNISGITELEIPFNDHMNVICGTNGIGKTTILNSIAAASSPYGPIEIKKKYDKKNESAYIVLNLRDGKHRKRTIQDLQPDETPKYEGDYEEIEKNTINFTISRNIKYRRVKSINAVERFESYGRHKFIDDGIENKDLKDFLINKLMSDNQYTKLTDNNKKNIKLIIKSFSIIDNKIKFEKLDADNFEIILKYKNDEVLFEFLSAGYKALMFIILGIIKEIGIRHPSDFAGDFAGVILIDEIDMHLHPTWQKEVIRILREVFPECQFILTTHSPSILQAILPGEIIPLELDEDGEVRIKELYLNNYGLQGWTLEEILTDVMGLDSSKSDVYRATIKDFQMALSTNNTKLMEESYDKLDHMLHPQNELRQILRIQMVGVGDD